jgi:hypothetical protein
MDSKQHLHFILANNFVGQKKPWDILALKTWLNLNANSSIKFDENERNITGHFAITIYEILCLSI